MNQIVIFKLWQHKLPAITTLATIAFIFLWPSIPLRGVMEWLRFFYYYSPQNYLYSAIALLSGLYVGAYIYNRTVSRCCTVQSLKSGTSGSIIGILLGACPACIPVLGFLFPLSVTIVLSRLSILFLVVSIGIMIFSLWRIGGFQKVDI